MPRFVFATFNPGKLREVAGILDGLPVQVVGPRDVGLLTVPREDGDTFLDNAVIKAVYAWTRTGLPALADDSGLVVEALDGAPGVHSARFAGEAQDDAANIDKLVDALRGVADRRARFVCCAVCILGPEWATGRIPETSGEVRLIAGHPGVPEGCHLLAAHGEVAGRIIDQPMGTDGFGYDPVFFLDELGRTFAQLGRDEKNGLSHRGRAFRALRQALEGMLAP